MKPRKSLRDILLTLNENKKGNLIFDGFLEYSETVTYLELYSTLKNISSHFENMLNNQTPNLFAIYSKTWDRNFYEIILSVLFSNNAFIIIDSNWPDDFILSTLQTARPNFLIFNNLDIPRVFLDLSYIAKHKYDSIVNKGFQIISYNDQFNKMSDLTYVICTSGTCGLPKVVHVLNSSIMPNIKQLCEIFELNEENVLYQGSSLTFDPSLIEIFCAFYSGASLLILPQSCKLAPRKLNSFLIKHKISFLQLTPTLYRSIAEIVHLNKSLKCLALGGEAFPVQMASLKPLIQSGIKLYNLYGITELSCWSSCHLVQVNDLENELVPIGKPLNETNFFIKYSESDLALFEITADLLPCEGFLYHSSKTRVTYVNGERHELIFSGDLVAVKAGQLYVKGRADRKVKINGKLTDLYKLDMVCKEIHSVQDCYSMLAKTDRIVLFIRSKDTLENLEKSIRNLIKKKLPSHFEPFKIVPLNDEHLPMTSHGKIDTEALMRLYINSKDVKVFDSLENILKFAWKEVLINEPNATDMFVHSGGDSLKALMFIERVEESLSTLYPYLKANKLLDTLLTKPYENLIGYLKSQISNQTCEMSVHVSKRFKQDTNESQIKIDLKEGVKAWFSKHQTNLSMIGNPAYKSFEYKVKTNWKYDTRKCVDATPLLIVKKNAESVILIGSHSAEFFCIDAAGGLVWSFKTNDRIESSAIISKCCRFVIFGCYDNNVYVLRVNDGCLEFKITTGDIVKSSPCLNEQNGHVYIGSYDKNLYCISIEEKVVMWKLNLDSSSIFSGPILSGLDLFVTTLSGNLFSLSSTTGTINWKCELGKPLFTSPVVNSKTSSLFVGCCGGLLHCVTFDNKIKWRFKTGQAIFSTACLTETSLMFGSHDNHLYCLNQESGSLTWKINILSPIFSSPRVLNNVSIACISSNGVLCIVSLKGELLIKKDLFNKERSCFSSPIIYENKMVIGSRDDCLYQFEIN